jgi:hypothetical protein
LLSVFCSLLKKVSVLAIKQNELFDILKVVANFVLMAVDGNGVIETVTPQVRVIFKKNEGEIEGLLLTDLIPELGLLGQEKFTPIQARGGLDLMGDEEAINSPCMYLEYLAAYEQRNGHYELKTTVSGESRELELATYKLISFYQRYNARKSTKSSRTTCVRTSAASLCRSESKK